MPEIQGDSISRCSHDNSYQNRDFQSTHSHNRSQTSGIFGKDKIESSEDKMEREALKKICGSNAHLINRSFVILGQVGKFTFLVVMLPSYLFLYQVPKWLLLEAFPQLFSSTVKIAQKLNDPLRRLLSFVIAKTSALTKFTKVLKLENIAQFLQPLNATIKPVFAALRRSGHGLIAAGGNLAKKILERTHLIAAQINKVISPPLRQAKLKMTQTLKSVTEVTANFAAQNLSKLLQASARALNQGKKALSRLTRAGADGLLAGLKSAPKIAAEAVLNSVQALTQHVIQPMINLMLSSTHLLTAVKKGSAWTATKLIHQAAKFREMALSFAKALPTKIAALFNAAENIALKILDPILQGILLPLQSLANKLKQFIQKRAKTGTALALVLSVNSWEFIKAQSFNLWALLVRKFFQLMDGFQENLKKLAENAKAIPRKIKQNCLVGLQILKIALKSLLLLLRNFFRWIGLLYRHSMQRVRAIALSLEERFLP